MAILTKRKKMGLLLIAAAVAAAMVIWTWGAGDEAAATDNAYIRGDVTSLAPKVAGYVIAVEVKDNQVVRAGDILFRTEDRDYRARSAQPEAKVKAAGARVAKSAETIPLQHILVRNEAAKRRAADAVRWLARKTRNGTTAWVQ